MRTLVRIPSTHWKAVRMLTCLPSIAGKETRARAGPLWFNTWLLAEVGWIPKNHAQVSSSEDWTGILLWLVYEAVACRRLESELGSQGWEPATDSSLSGWRETPEE